jgi:hypothetical protein
VAAGGSGLLLTGALAFLVFVGGLNEDGPVGLTVGLAFRVALIVGVGRG